MLFELSEKSKEKEKLMIVKNIVDKLPTLYPSEILMVCKKTGKPLPFGTLGKNKREDVADSVNNCLYIFDVLLYNKREYAQQISFGQEGALGMCHD
ncbi:hypothetical protein O3P69_014209 [Scylla paramamosain]|uniref:ATP-dependent DNA ligase family profile domain-containing protein n=1 Tax=Scylla paramamosain TaxID=85552 RepID=A0AAW0SA49_SCYPA